MAKFRVTDEERRNFLRQAKVGMVYTSTGDKWISRLIMWGQRKFFGSKGLYSHTGIMGYDGFMWEMVWTCGLRHHWLGNYLRKGSTKKVVLWDIKPKYKKYISDKDRARAFTAIKDRFVTATKYDRISILTFGMLHRRGKMVCSDLVWLYLQTALEHHINLNPGEEFLTPDEIEKYFIKVAEI